MAEVGARDESPVGRRRAEHRVVAEGDVGREGRSMAVKRLKSARGHLDGVIRMLEADRYCMDVLHQLTAVEGAIARAHREILETHARGCVVDAMRDGRIEDAIEEVLSAVYGDRSPAGRGATRAVQ